MTTLDTIRTLLIEDFKVSPEALTADARLEDLGIDSLGMAEVVFALEDTFGLSIPDAATGLSTLGELVAYMDTLQVAHASQLATPSASPNTVTLP